MPGDEVGCFFFSDRELMGPVGKVEKHRVWGFKTYVIGQRLMSPSAGEWIRAGEVGTK